MKRLYILFLLFSALALTNLAAQSTAAAELTFVFTRQGGFSSNQFAVWIEDAQGRHVKSLYATRFTANGGYKRRPNSIPLWVKQSGLDTMNKAQVDAITSATPKTGSLSYQWDGTDNRNASLPAGNYIIFLEATLRGDNQVVYSAPISLGQGAATPTVKTEYIGNPGSEQAMIKNVVVKTLR